MDSKSTTSTDFLDNIRDVSDSLKQELTLGREEEEFEERKGMISSGPAPTMNRRKLIFDSMKLLISNGCSADGGGGENDDGGRYVYVFGAGYHGQLGRRAARGHKKYANIPISVDLVCAVRSISCGALHTAVVTDSGLVYSWGDGRMGQLGHLQEGFSNQPVATLVSSLQGVNVSTIACGQKHTMAVTSDGQVYSWGWAKYGQLGLGTRTNQRYPQLVSALAHTKISNVSCGDRHSVVISEGGHELYTFGSGEHGQLGHGDNHDFYTPKVVDFFKSRSLKIINSDCGSIHTAVVCDNGKLFIFGFGENLYGREYKTNFNYIPQEIMMKQVNRIKQVACGQSHILILTGCGDVYGWGDGSYGEIGQGAYKASQMCRAILLNKNIESIAAGRYHSAALTNCGSLYTWGCGDNGQLGRLKNNALPKLCVALLPNVVGQISCGEHHTCVLASCRYKNLADDVMEYAKLDEMEFEAKLNLLSSSKQKGRGISKKDLLKIKKWRREQEEKFRMKKENDLNQENLKIQKEIEKITKINDIKTIKKDMNQNNNNNKDHNNKDMHANDDDDDDDNSDSSDNSSMMSDDNNNQNTQNKTQNKSSNNNNKDISNNKDNNQTDALGKMANTNRVTAKVANQSRCGFHESSRNFLYEMASQMTSTKLNGMDGKENNGDGINGSLLNDNNNNNTSKSPFVYRSEYDKLKLLAHRKEEFLVGLDEELAMLQEVDDCSELASQRAEMSLRSLGMKLNTVMIKISEAERSRRTYELNIVHIRDESQENHKQLDGLRRNLFLQENLKKKILKFRDYALKQKEFAICGLKEFESELSDWRSFLDFQYRHLASLAKMNTKNEMNNENNKQSINEKQPINEKQAKKQERAMIRINKIKKLVENNEKEIEKLTEKLHSIGEKNSFFQQRFERIYAETGLIEANEIINKFFVNREIQNEQIKILDEMQKEKKVKEESLESLNEKLAKKQLSSSNYSKTWREVDLLNEKLNKAKHELVTHKISQQTNQRQFTLLNQWAILMIENLNKSNNSNNSNNINDTNELFTALSDNIYKFNEIITQCKNGDFSQIKTQNQNNHNNSNVNLNINLKGNAKNTNNQNNKKKSRKTKYNK